jgi:simple sugar transport system permease protein/ribose transport system permease protein
VTRDSRLRFLAAKAKGEPLEDTGTRTIGVVGQRPGSIFRRYAFPISVGIAIVVLIIGISLTTPAFLTTSNLLTIVRAAAITGIAALGMTFITISGNYFSLAVEQTAAFCAIIFALAMAAGFGLVVAILVTLVVAAVIGLAVGAIVALGANPIIATLGAGAGLYGLSAIVTNNKQIQLGSHDADFLGQGQILSVPTQSYAFILLAVVAMIALTRTRFGRQIVLVGANKAAATASGIQVGLAVTAAFVLCSIGAAISGIFVAAQFGQGIVNQFDGFNTDVIAAVLVGGNAIQGGEGSAVRTALGAIFIALLVNFTLLRGYPYGVRVLLEGAAILVGVIAYHFSQRGNR